MLLINVVKDFILESWLAVLKEIRIIDVHWVPFVVSIAVWPNTLKDKWLYCLIFPALTQFNDPEVNTLLEFSPLILLINLRHQFLDSTKHITIKHNANHHNQYYELPLSISSRLNITISNRRETQNDYVNRCNIDTPELLLVVIDVVFVLTYFKGCHNPPIILLLNLVYPNEHQEDSKDVGGKY